MTMNCKPISTIDERINDIRMRTAEIVNNDILPNEGRLWAERRAGESFNDRTEVLQLRADIKEKVKKAGLWAPHLPAEYGGMGLDFLAHGGGEKAWEEYCQVLLCANEFIYVD